MSCSRDWPVCRSRPNKSSGSPKPWALGWLPRSSTAWTLLSQGSPSALTLYLGMDGTGIPMRAAALQVRPGEQPDGSAKTREVKTLLHLECAGC